MTPKAARRTKGGGSTKGKAGSGGEGKAPRPSKDGAGKAARKAAAPKPTAPRTKAAAKAPIAKPPAPRTKAAPQVLAAPQPALSPPAEKAAAKATPAGDGAKPAAAKPFVKPKPGGKPGSADWVPGLDDDLIRDYVMAEVGEYGLRLARIIEEREPVLGVELIDSIEDKPSNVRKILYKLEHARVAEYEKDTDKSGWETFTWRLTLNEVKYLLNQRRRDELDDVRRQLEVERNTTFFSCPERHQRVEFEAASNLAFNCPECGKPMANVDNEAVKVELKRRIVELEKMVFA